MMIAGPIVVLVCGIVVLIGVFLPWISGPAWWPTTITLSGWDGVSQYGLNNATEACLVFFGGVLIIGFALPAVIASLTSKGSQKTVRNLCILASVAALLAVGDALWALIPIVSDDLTDFVSYGFYISFAAAILGLVFGIIASVRAATRVLHVVQPENTI